MSRTHRDTGFYGRPVCTLNNVLAQRSSSHEEQHTQHASLYILNNLLADSLFIRKTNITFCPTRIFSHKAVTVAPSVSTTRTVNALPTTRSSSFGPVSTLFSSGPNRLVTEKPVLRISVLKCGFHTHRADIKTHSYHHAQRDCVLCWAHPACLSVTPSLRQKP